MPVVAATEMLILAIAGLVLLRSGLRPGDQPALLLFAFFLLTALAVSLADGAPFVDMARNAAVMSVFLMLGMRTDEQSVIRAFLIAAVLVAAVLLLEALSFDDRFSILNIIGHRTSSLFLEQVSLANFAILVAVFATAFWPRLPIGWRIFLPLLIAGILVTNNSRTGLAIVLAAPLVYVLAPRLPALVTLAVMPLVIGAATLVALTTPPSREDNLAGRLQLTVQTLRDLDIVAFLGGSAGEAGKFLDSGYTFVIYASSIFGLLVLWLFFSLVATGNGAAQKRASMMTGLYLFCNLMVSGTSVFSIKTAALLWLLMGHLRAVERRGAEKAQRRA
jgi:hypothetical protein